MIIFYLVKDVKLMTMYVITHKEISTTLPTGYTPLLVGANSNKLPDNLTYLKDNTGENISSKNPNYCELTGLYWIWKNSTAKNVGICHYRRFFTKDNTSTKLRRNLLSLIEQTKPLNINELDRYLTNFDIVVPIKEHCEHENLWTHYTTDHNIRDLIVTRDVIYELFPDYIDSFNVTFNEDFLSLYNMCYTRKEIFDNYCSWLFEILFEVEKRIDISNYDNYQSRVFGFLSERLFNVWLNQNSELKIKYIHVFNSEIITRKRLFKRLINKK
jgi:hypothetical protein